jgi:quercetin dioxygenase-like cupin family protein
MSMRVVSRDELPSISSVEVDEMQHDLGIVKDFRAHASLTDFIPDLARLSVSWVHLAPGQELAVHAHPTKSMIIVADGAGQVNGDVVEKIRTGDIVVVPPGARHGFVGDDPAGFWALSVQFEGSGLYEDPEAPRVAFEASGSVALVIEENQRFMKLFECGSLVELARSCAGSDDAALREGLLDSLQPWSDAFQRLIAQRAAAEGDPVLGGLAWEHLKEELGHNRLLARSRSGRESAEWDPVVASVAAWFAERMSVASSVERTVLAHLVLEGSGLVFHQAAGKSFPGSAYFSEHSENDVEHLDMGYRALAGRTDWSVDQVFEILRQGWAMMTLLCDRIADRARA